MLTPELTAVAGAVAVVGPLMLRQWLRARRLGLPFGMGTAKLVLAEDSLSTDKPVPLHGKPDEVYDVRGKLVIVDTKTRKADEVRESDIIQLSVYAACLRHGTTSSGVALNRPVARRALVRIKTDDDVRFRRVRLMSDRKLTRLWRRYWAVLDGQKKPRAVSKPQYCLPCGHSSVCPKSAVKSRAG